jgi:hypothetical protein
MARPPREQPATDQESGDSALTEHHYHAVQFYKDEGSLAATVATFLDEGIRAGQPALVIGTATHTTVVCDRLRALGHNISVLKETGELLVFDARKMMSAFMVDGMPDPLRFRSSLRGLLDRLCASRQPCPIRAYGEMVDLLWQEGNTDAAIRLEILWNQMARDYDFALLCGYAVGHFYKETARDAGYEAVRALHSHVVPSV